MSDQIEAMAKRLAWAEMVFELERSGVMAISPERLQATFDNAWAGTSSNDDVNRERFRAMARAGLAS
jgi:hypothetical protein